MKKILRIVIQILIFPFPWSIRRLLLNTRSGVNINSSAKIGWSVVLADELIMESESVITNLTFINNIDKLVLKENSKIGRSNWVTGANKSAKMFSQTGKNCELIIGKHSRITSKHHIDCTGGVYIGEFTTIAGIRSQILTHSIDIKNSRQVADPVLIGRYCFVGTSAILLKDTKLPDYSVLGAGAVLTKKFDETSKLYAGNPAKPVKNFNKEEFKYFFRDHGHVD